MQVQLQGCVRGASFGEHDSGVLASSRLSAAWGTKKKKGDCDVIPQSRALRLTAMGHRGHLSKYFCSFIGCGPLILIRNWAGRIVGNAITLANGMEMGLGHSPTAQHPRQDPSAVTRNMGRQSLVLSKSL